MKKILPYTPILIFAILFASSAAFAWPDGERQGLVMGITGGVADVEFESNSSSSSGTGFMAGAMLGMGFNEQFILDFKYRYWNSDIDDITYHTWSWCGDIMVFPVKDLGLYLNAGGGPALALADIAGAESKSGTLIYAGIGYEITKWIFLSVDYGVGSFADDISSNTLTVALSIIGY